MGRRCADRDPDGAMAAAEAPVGRRHADQGPSGAVAAAAAQMEKEDPAELLAELEAAMAPLQPRSVEGVSQPASKKKAPKQAQGPPPAKGAQGSSRAAAGKGMSLPRAEGPAAKGANTGRKPRGPSAAKEQEEDEIQVVRVQKGELTLPARVKERHYDRDNQGRDAVPLLAGEGRLVIKKLLEGAHEVQKVIKFRKQRGKGHAAVDVDWETVAAPPSGQELRKIMEATAEANWPQEARVALGKKVGEIRRLAGAQGDRGLLLARGAVHTLLGGATPEWAANQEMRHQEEKDSLREEAWVAKQQLKEMREKRQEKKADFQWSDAVAAMNACLLKEVEAEKDLVTQLKAVARAAAEQRGI